MRFPNGLVTGNAAVMTGTMATLVEFDHAGRGCDLVGRCRPVSQLAPDCRDRPTGHGAFGAPTGKRFSIKVIADCAAKENTIYDEWLIRDYGGLVKQLGLCQKISRR